MHDFFKKITLGMAALATVLSLGAITMPAQASAASCEQPYTLRKGSRGICVKYLQRMLNTANDAFRYSSKPRLDVDGVFGDKTYAKVVAYQAFGLLTRDGVVGKNTFDELCSDIKLIYLNRPDIASSGDGYVAAVNSDCAYYSTGNRY
ncbi:MAG TPA: peptidoglycan-binding domain-containing protein [Candidatus Saccharimonadales bacterium]|nr:peptidoglycan-binding domain-containing protein [Candidatus Saccharimonadales bacterium]